MPQPLYVFDLDDTLINGDCAMLWSAFIAEQGIALDPDHAAKDGELMAHYATGTLDMAQYLDFSMAPLRHVNLEQVQQLAQQFVTERVLPRLYPQAQRLIAELTRDGMTMLIISASVNFIVQAVAQQIGIKHAIGIDLKIENQCYTSQVQGVASFREGKVTRLTDWLSDHREHQGNVHFFTDSINDLPLCQYADHTYLVNPCPRLAAHAKQTPWTVLAWA